MNTTTQHTTKYKNSPLGLIPEDWEVKLLASISNKIGDGLHGTPKYVHESEYFFVNGNNLKNNIVVIDENTKRVSYEEYLKHRKNLTKNCLLLSINGTIGNLSFYNNEKIVLGKSAAYINCKPENINYIFYYLQSSKVNSFFDNELTGSTIRNLSLKSIREIPILLPSTDEQTAIADCLSTWDKAIEKQNALIAQKELSKKALMQQLLSGKKRLKGFNREWDKIKMKDIGVIPNKNPIQKLENQKLLTVKLYVKGVEFNESTIPIISKSGRPYYERRKGEILIGRQNIHNGGIGLVSEIFDGGICSNAISSFLVDESKFSKKFIFFYLSNPVNYKKIENFMGGTGQKELSEKQLLELEIRVPLLLEQLDIANVLQCADDELQLLKKKLKQLKEQKKGLMQVLLTGKKRLRY